MSDTHWKPIYCLADSQLLFWRPRAGGEPWLASLRRYLPPVGARGAYIGASNGDEPAYFGLFSAAMDVLGVPDRRHIHADFSPEDRAYLARADLILLAGGDPVHGWQVLTSTGMEAVIRDRFTAGALLLGVSAGAVQLGWACAPDVTELGPADLVYTLRLVPALLGAHEEAADWHSLRRLQQAAGLHLAAYGIPTGGGLVYDPQTETLAAIREALIEFTLSGGATKDGLIWPDASQGVTEPGSARTHREPSGEVATRPDAT